MTSVVAGTLSDDPVVEIEDELRLGGQVGQPVAGGGSKDPAEVNDVAQPVEGDLKFAGAPPERRPVVVMSMVRSSIVEQASMASAWRASFLNRTSLVSACAAKDVWRGYLRSAEPMGEGGALADTGGESRMTLELTAVRECLDPDKLVLEYTSHGQVVATGGAYENSHIGVYRFSEGRIWQVREFHNSLITERARPSGSRN